MKSAYELALERMEKQGIGRPREDALSDEARAAIAEARNKAEARLAEVEILYRDRRRKAGGATPEDEEHYQRDRRRIEDERDRAIAKIRGER